jgi:hypothetical protein
MFRCIIQDDAEDWNIEASRMRDVYRRAAYCIAATAGRSSNVGLFFDRDAQALTMIKITLTWSSSDRYGCWPAAGTYWCGGHWLDPVTAVDMAPLNRRAWVRISSRKLYVRQALTPLPRRIQVAQERLLSPRVLHFTQSMLFWECNTGVMSETFADGDDCWSSLYGYDGPLTLKDTLYGNQDVKMLQLNHYVNRPGADTVWFWYIYRSWCMYRKSYTECGLTKASDILVALCGITQEVGEALGSRCIAGLWEKTFVEEMCWKPLPGNGPFDYRRLTQWRAPSWSWASTTLPVEAGQITTRLTQYSTSRELVKITEFLVDAKISGALVHASLKMQCRLIPVRLHYSDFTSSSAQCYPKETGTETEAPLPENCFPIHLDDPLAPRYKVRNVHDVYLIVLRQSGKRDRYLPYSEGLAIAQCDDQPDRFERIGSFSFYASSQKNFDKFLAEKLEVVKEQTIELV